MAKKQKENPVGCTGEGKSWKGNIREGSREGKTGTILELSLEVKSRGEVQKTPTGSYGTLDDDCCLKFRVDMCCNVVSYYYRNGNRV